jgi:predicted membrane protein
MDNFKKTRVQDNPNSRIVAGVILVGVGIALLLRNMNFLLPHWLFTWPVILILVGIYTGFKHDFKNSSWIILIAIGVFFLVSKYIPTLHLATYFWPILIIAAGIIYIIKPSKHAWGNWDNDKNKIKDNATNSSWHAFEEDAAVDSNNEFSIRSVFSGVKRNIITKNFKRGRITTIFGGAEINMSQADMTSPSYINVDVAFGGVELIVPANWTIQNDIQGVFHGVEDKRYNNAVVVDPTKVLVLKGNCAFGGIEVKSY